ncbi:MAG: DUF2782 domain-containing protein [Pseudogulbenkiania sp.]|nr:DUF2782 domain-containing protein [Pseudogulbenkiania sp.]
MRRLLPLLLLVAVPALADTPAKAVVPPPPNVAVDGNAAVEPEVRIIQKGTDKIEEYRINGQLYMIKVTPSHGVPYYLMDEEGNGSMKQIDSDRRVVIPRWVLFRF